MKRTNLNSTANAFTVALAACSTASFAATPLRSTAPAPETSTSVNHVYQDAQGNQHPWTIDDGHVLHWDGKPYLPVGGAFEPRYWTLGQTEDNWNADIAALESLKKSHVIDLYLTSGNAGLTHIPSAAVQRIVDYLDAGGFHYGIEIADCNAQPLTGFNVKPSLYRQVGPGPKVRFDHLSGLTSAFYAIAATDSETPIFGKARMVDSDTAEASARGAGPEDVLLLYPERAFLDGTPEHALPDLWQGFDDYRDRLIGYFSHIKLGPGFRFFLDPIVRDLNFAGDIPSIVPTSDGYRISFQAWLVKKYDHNVDDLNQSWGIKERDLPDFATAARCIPLWNGTKGIPYLYEPTSGISYAVLNKPKMLGHEWDDIADFRRESVRGYMNTLANILKKSIANVPVVYRCPKDASIFVNDQPDGGFDGLGIEAFGHSTELSTAASASGYADMEQWTRPGWLIVSDTFDTADIASKTNAGYDSRAVLFNDWDELQNVGARGFFTSALQRLPEDKYAKANIAALPDQSAWLGSYAATLQASPLLSSAGAPTLSYPTSVTGLGLSARQLRNGVWWLPTHGVGAAVPMGPSLRCYWFTDSNTGQMTYVLWSVSKAMTLARLPFGKQAKPIITNSLGGVLPLKDKGGTWPVPVGDEPILIKNVAKLPLPLELTDEAKKQALDLIKMAADQGANVDLYRTRLFYATNKLDDKADASGLRLTLLSNLVNTLLHDLEPYFSFEGESATTQSFNSIATDPSASGGAYLSLDTNTDAPLALFGSGHGYQAQFKFKVNSPGRYKLWMGGSVLNSDQVSPFSYRVDGGAYQDVRGVPPDGAPYGGKFAWSDLGNLTLKAGNHTLEIMVAERRHADDHFTLAVDAFCFTKGGFRPDGLNAPTMEAASAQ